MVSNHVGVRLLAAVCFLCSAAALPLAVSYVSVQISTTTDDRVYKVMRENLTFLPPDQNLYVVRWLWRETPSSMKYPASLQIFNADTTQGYLNTVNPSKFITRDGGTQPKNFSPSDKIVEYERESRLFRVTRCEAVLSTAYYYEKGPVTDVLSPQFDEDSQLLRLSLLSTNEKIDCNSGNIKVQDFPQSKPKLASFLEGNVGASTSKAPRVQLVADFKDELFVVGIRKSKSSNMPELQLLPYRTRSCKTATAFYYKEYDEYHVREEDGTLVHRPAFTLQHAATRMYITSDVLDNLALNTAGTGVTLKHESEFIDPDELWFPDYRYFSRYDDHALNFRNGNEPLKRNISYYNRTVHIFCAAYHRKYCLLPAKSGLLRHVAASPHDQCAYPRLADPSPGFFDFLESLDGNSIIPTWRFLLI